jgi:hypothetical protein
MKFRDLWRRKEAAGALGLPGSVAIATFLLAVFSLRAVNERAIDAVSHRDLAAISLSRASQSIMMAPYAILSLLDYDDNTEASRRAPALFLNAAGDAKRSLDAAMRFAPDKAARIAEFKKRFEALIEMAKAPLVIANATPGLTRGAELSAADLGQLAEGARAAAEVDGQMQSLADDITAFDNAFIGENLETAANLNFQFDAAMLTMLMAGAAALALVRTSARRRLEFQLNLLREAPGKLDAADEAGPSGEADCDLRDGLASPPPERGSAAPLTADALPVR